MSYFKPKHDIFLLEEIIDSIIELRENGMIELVNKEAEYINIPNSYLWRCWFKLTDKGRKTLTSLDL